MHNLSNLSSKRQASKQAAGSMQTEEAVKPRSKKYRWLTMFMKYSSSTSIVNFTLTIVHWPIH